MIQNQRKQLSDLSFVLDRTWLQPGPAGSVSKVSRRDWEAGKLGGLRPISILSLIVLHMLYDNRKSTIDSSTIGSGVRIQ